MYSEIIIVMQINTPISSYSYHECVARIAIIHLIRNFQIYSTMEQIPRRFPCLSLKPYIFIVISLHLLASIPDSYHLILCF